MMGRTRIKIPLNADDSDQKKRLMVSVGSLRGKYMVDIKPVNPRLSNAQRGYFHGVVVQQFYEFLNDPGHGDGSGQYSFKQCKDVIVAKILGTKDVVNPLTGEVLLGVRPSTEKLSKPEYAELIDGAILWLAEQFGIVTPEPNGFYDHEAAKTAAGRN